MIGTVFTDVGDPSGPEPAELTTPGAIDVQRLLARMVDHGCDAVVMEVSSHALHQGRTAGLDFAAGVFTNLTGDHLDYHGTMEAYADAKAILFDGLSAQACAIVNGDDPVAGRMVRDTAAHVLRTHVCPPRQQREGHETARAEIGSMTASGSDVAFVGPWGSFDVLLPLVGRHNVSNALQALAVAAVMTHASGKALREALSQCPSVPGRLERVTASGETPAPNVLVDYAHTHDALRNVLEALRPLVSGRLIVLVGCGGDRDKTKRPKMARVAADLADRVVITSDNPRTEDPDAIIADMLEGVSGHETRVDVIADRAAAIASAINVAEPQDTVLLAGKGHEDYQIVGTTKRHFDDREHAAAALRQREKDRPSSCPTPS